MLRDLVNTVGINKSEDIRNITQHVIDGGYIKHIIYTKIYKDKTRIFLCDNPKWFEAYHSDLYNLGLTNRSISSYSAGLVIPSNLSDSLIFNIAISEFNMGYPVYLINKSPEACEIMAFSGGDSYSQFSGYCASNLDFLKKFTFYFKNEAFKLIKEVQKDRLILPKAHESTVPLNTTNNLNLKSGFLEEKINRYFFSIDMDNTYLTSKEVLCIKYLIQGNSAKQIAKRLHISYRTVQAHLEKSKFKMQAKNKFELISKIIELGIINKFNYF